MRDFKWLLIFISSLGLPLSSCAGANDSEDEEDTFVAPLSLVALTPPRHIILHLGAHKTGSTFLQQALEHNRKPLEAMGMGYLSQLNIVRSPNLRTDLANAFSRFQTVIMSNELFLGRVCYHAGNPVFYPDASATLGKLKDLLAPFHAIITPVLYIRNQASALESHFMQFLNDAMLKSFDEFKKETASLYASWGQVFQTVHTFFPEPPVVRCFESLAAQGEEAYLNDFVFIVSQVSSIPRTKQVTLKDARALPTNQSLSVGGMEVAKALLPHLLPLGKHVTFRFIHLLKAHLNNKSYSPHPVRAILSSLQHFFTGEKTLSPELLSLIENTLQEVLKRHPVATRPLLYTPQEKKDMQARYASENRNLLKAHHLEEFADKY